MMRDRLVLLKKLLRKDGVIFVQIDDREMARLYLLLSEIFSEDSLKTISLSVVTFDGSTLI